MTTPVNFEIAKLLKEKGFCDATERYYEQALTSKKDSETQDYSGTFGWKRGETNLQSGFFRNNGGMADLSNDNWYMCSAPTIGQVIMWLYEKCGVWVEVQHCGMFNQFGFKLSKLDNLNIRTEPHYIHPLGEGYKSPMEAYVVGIKYTLDNLI